MSIGAIDIYVPFLFKEHVSTISNYKSNEENETTFGIN